MMRAKADSKATSNSILVLACLLLAGAAVGLLWPKPKASDLQKKAAADTAKLNADLAKTRSATTVAKATVATQTWSGEPAAIQDQVLTLTATLVKKRSLGFVRLQPQKANVGGALDQYPFLLVVEGPFPAIAALERDLEAAANRLAVNSFQVTSSDSESDKVSASISLVAHRVPAVQEKTTNAKRSP